MKADTIVLSEQDATCTTMNAKQNFPIKKKLAKYFSAEEVTDHQKGVIVLQVDQLTDKQLQQFQNIPGARFLSADPHLNIDSISSINQAGSEQQTASPKQRFLVKHSTRLISLEAAQIAYFYAENRLNFLRTWNNKTFIIDKTIEEISRILNKNDFYRINRSYIIAYKSIEEVYTHFNNRLKLKLNISVPEEIFVSKDRVAGFKEWLGA